MTKLAVAFGVPLTDGLGCAGDGEIVRERTRFSGGTAPLAMKFAWYVAEILC